MDKTLLPNDKKSFRTFRRSLLHHSRVFMHTSDQNLLCFHKDIDHSKRLPFDKLWIYVFSAGHIAAAVSLYIKHFIVIPSVQKEKHNKVSMTQNSFAKSAGAKLRRYSEAALIIKTQALLRSWSPYIKKTRCFS